MNLRLGFATNSSSSHSIVVVPPGTLRDDDVANGEFGWNPFTAASTESKLRWARACFKDALDRALGGAAGPLFARLFPESGPDDYVDHQSQLVIPSRYGTTFPSFDFLADLEAFLSREDIAILGGNDNDGWHPLEGKYLTGAPWPDRLTDCGDGWACRSEGPKQWTLFNSSTGTRVSFAFDGSPIVYKRPLLADVKITDYCPFACSFCYQGSTESGKPAILDDIRRVARALRKAEVFEVALGGGEPTLHPDFEEVVDIFRYSGMVVNFTTKNLKWLHKNKWWREKCGAVGFSLGNVGELLSFLDLRARSVLHVIPGLYSGNDLKYLVERFLEIRDSYRDYGEDSSILFLGWKPVGRAASMPPKNGEQDLPAILRGMKRLPKISIDTCLAAKWQAGGALDGLPEWMYETKDGTSSFYVDAVARTSASSSYGEERWPWTPKGIKTPQGGYI